MAPNCLLAIPRILTVGDYALASVLRREAPRNALVEVIGAGVNYPFAPAE
jgi:hypothetical protein